MRFEPTAVEGAWLIVPEPIADARGWFARTFDRDAFAARGLVAEFPLGALSFNHVAGTLRGLHYQLAPHAEAKLVRCTAGAIWDVVVDLRPGSPTHRRWAGVELSAANRHMLYLPPGCAHGFQTLAAGSELAYQLSAPFAPELARGHRYDDPAFAIAWPSPVACIADKDLAWPPYDPELVP